MKEKLAICGGRPIREVMLPYGRQSIDENDIEAVTEVLRSDWLTTGPRVSEFEQAFAKTAGTANAVAVSNGTAALHAAVHAVDIGPGDEVIVPPMTFAATANAVVFQGATPVFADVDPGTLLLDPGTVEQKLTPRTRAVIAVDYAGQPCDYDALRSISARHDLWLIADACHSLGATYKGRPAGALSDLSAFSMHPVKPITTGEGGMVTTSHEHLGERMRIFRNHGITSDHRKREEQGSWVYEMVELGYNYRLTDFQCALGIQQLRKLRGWVTRRQEIAEKYTQELSGIPSLDLVTTRPDVTHAYHLFPIKLVLEQLKADRASIFTAMRAEGIGVNVHYIPVHLHPFYRQRYGTTPGLCPVAENAYERLLTLPIFPLMSDRDVSDVVAAVRKVLSAFTR